MADQRPAGTGTSAKVRARARRLFRDMAETNGRPEPLVVQRALAIANEHLAGGRVGDARFLYREVLDADPGNPEAMAGLTELDEPAQIARRPLPKRLLGRIARPAIEHAAQRPRVWKYQALSTCPRLTGTPIRLQPVLFVGPGEIVLGESVQFGWKTSPLFYAGYCYVEAACAGARIELGDRVEFNNNAMLKSEGAGIRVGADGLFGANVEIFDSDFHELHPARRRGGVQRMAPVDIGANVFVGMSVKVLKGVTIGADSVIGAGAVVASSIPAGVIAAGNPARVIREL
jgi:acetyltransferase-like isoleucine patch superfamily enzyme